MIEQQKVHEQTGIDTTIISVCALLGYTVTYGTVFEQPGFTVGQGVTAVNVAVFRLQIQKYTVNIYFATRIVGAAIVYLYGLSLQKHANHKEVGVGNVDWNQKLIQSENVAP